MSATVKHTFSTFMEKRPKRTRKYGQSDPEMTIPEEIFKYLPDDVQEAMSTLTTEKQHSLYLDIFKPLDFYELLFKSFEPKNKWTVWRTDEEWPGEVIK